MSYKKFDLSNDVASIVSSVNEVVAVSGSIYTVDDNVKRFDNIASGSSAVKLGGYFKTVYDASPTSSLSTPIADFTYGHATGSSYNTPGVSSIQSVNEKIKIYRHFAQALLGDRDALFNVNGSDVNEAFFITFKRNIQKDEVKKNTVGIVVNTDLAAQGVAQYTASDAGALTAFKQKPGGEFAPLKISGSSGTEVGQVWYQAGVIILPTSTVWENAVDAWSGSEDLHAAQFSASIDELVDGLRSHMERIDLHNQTNLHSTVFFCRALNNEFNYSSNPTFIDAEQRIRVTSGSNILQTRTYITTVGLYDANDNLLAVGKVNKPILKSPDTEAVLRIRMDF